MNQIKYPHLGLLTYSLTNHEDTKERIKEIHKKTIDNYPIDGFRYFYPLGDTEGLLVLYSVNIEGHPPQSLSCLDSLKSQIHTDPNVQDYHSINSSQKIGRTWILLGIVPSFWENFNIDSLAKEACEKLNLGAFDTVPNPQKFMGATLWEFWQPPEKWEALADENQHLVIILYPDEKSLETFNDFKIDWLRLFYYRHKILWAYSNSRNPEIKAFLKQHLLPFSQQSALTQLNLPQSEKLELELIKLKEELKKNYDIQQKYANYLSFLEVQLQTLSTNLYNYQERLKLIHQKAKTRGSTDSNLLQEFSEIPALQYKVQIETDIAALRPGLQGRDIFVSTIRGIVDIKQAESDRTFQYTVETWGVGLAVTGITATSISPFIPQMRGIDQQTPTDAFANASVTLIVSVIAGSIAKWATEQIIQSTKTNQANQLTKRNPPDELQDP